jgi:mono/diheme cytochrome c family protein
MKTSTTKTYLLLTACGAAALLGAMGGCRGDREDAPPRQFFPDLDDQPKWKPQEKSEFFPDGRTMRKPVAGTVAFGRKDFVVDPGAAPWASTFMRDRDDLLKEDTSLYLGLKDDGKEYVETIPIKVDMDLLKLGQKKFNIYCSVCHGYTGDGQGMVGSYFAVKPANFHDPKYITPDPTTPDPLTRDGYVFHVAREGVRSMPGYAHALTERETWAVVSYLRALQQSQMGTIQDVPEAQRPKVQNEFTLENPAPATPPAGATPTPAPTGGAK